MVKKAEQIKNFWKPDGVTRHTENEALLKEWMQLNGLSLQPGAITTLIYSSVHRSARAAAVKTLLSPNKSNRKRGAT